MYKTLLPLLLIISVACSSLRKTYPVAQIKTSKGEILFWLHDETPNHKQSFIKLAEAGYWDSLTFNRVIKDFVVQGGCPDTPEGFVNSPYLIKPEFNTNLKHIYGAVGGGRDENVDKITAGCQFYIVQKKEGLTRLDSKYVIFGQVFKGMDIVDEIVSVEKDLLGTPLSPIKLDINIIRLTSKKLKANGYILK